MCGLLGNLSLPLPALQLLCLQRRIYSEKALQRLGFTATQIYSDQCLQRFALQLQDLQRQERSEVRAALQWIYRDLLVNVAIKIYVAS